MLHTLVSFVLYLAYCRAERASFCYGDNSFSSNFVNISCAVGVIRVRDIIAASKPQSAGCPLASHTYSPADQTQCCTYLDGDCLQVYAGPDSVHQRFLGCNGQPKCDDIQVVWQQTGIACNALGTFPFVTNYMIFDFDCVPDGQIDGLCSNTPDCTVTYSHCNNTLCDCNDAHTELHDACYPDVTLHGNCGANSYCADANTVCRDGSCVCDTHYTESGGVCITDRTAPERSTFCRGTGFPDRVHATCSDGVIFVTDVLTASKPAAASCPDLSNSLGPAEYGRCCSYTGGDCIQSYQGEISGYLACNGKKTCEGMPAVQQRTDPTCSGDFPEFSNYVILEYTCVQDGQINGACDDTIVCTPTNAVCQNNICTCDLGYSHLDGSCWKDGEIKGACNDTAGCIPDNSKCLDDRCTCITGYSHFAGVCWKDTHLKGSCGVSGTCVDPNTICTEGRCVCAAGYTDINGQCLQDGSLGGYCQRDSDCQDSNANCNQQFICVCKNLYTAFNGICKEDGKPEGKCLSSVQACTDAHSLCIDGVCQCNDVRNYHLKDGQCVRNDTFIHGTCSTGLVCIDQNADCVNGICSCKTSYVEQNGQCVRDTVNYVTSCVGASPYNVLQPDCSPGMSALTVREMDLYKAAPAQCPASFDVYDEALFQQCCSYSDTDCQPSVLTCGGSYNYQVKEYKCVNDTSHTTIDSDSTVRGQPIYLSGPTDITASSGSCSIQAACLTNIKVYLVTLDLKESGGVCRQRLIISEDSNTTHLTCENNTAVQVPVYVATSGYLTVSWLNQDTSLHGTFILEYEATDGQTLLEISCGSSLQQKTSIGQCTRTRTGAEGLISHPCLEGGVCLNTTARCTDGVCVCIGGYTLTDGDCRSTTAGEDGDDSGPSITVLLAILIPLSLMLLIAIALIVFCLCRDKLCRRKLEEKPAIESVAVVTPFVERHPTPARTNFGGKIPENASKPPLKRHQTLLDFIKNEAEVDDMTKKNLNRQQTYHPGMTGMDSNVNTRFQRYFKPHDALVPSQSVVTAKPPLATSAPPPKTADEEKARKGKKKRLKKLKRKARIGILAAKGFELPREISQTDEKGKYTRITEPNSYAIGPFPALQRPPLRTRQTEPSLQHIPQDAYAQDASQYVGPTVPHGRLPPLKRHASTIFPYNPNLSQTLPISGHPPVYPVERTPDMSSYYGHPSPAQYFGPQGVQSYYLPRPTMMQHVPGSPTSPFSDVGQFAESGYFHPPPRVPPGAGSYINMPPQAPYAPAGPAFDPHSAWRRAGMVSGIAARPNLARRRSTLEISSFDTDDPLEASDLD